MGLIAKIKGFFAGPAIKKMSDKLVALCENEVIKRAQERIKDEAEDQAKEHLGEICEEVLKDQVAKIDDPTGISKMFGDKIVEAATPHLVDKVWDKVKDKIVKKKEGGEGKGGEAKGGEAKGGEAKGGEAKPAAPAAKPAAGAYK